MIRIPSLLLRAALPFALLVAASPAAAQSGPHPVDKYVTFPFPTDLVTASTGQRIAWVLEDHGVRNVWAATGPAWTPRQLTTFTSDDGQALTQLGFTPDGEALIFVRGGDHGSNWASPGGIEPNPTSAPERARVEIWTVPWTGGGGRVLVQGDEPLVSPRGDRVAYTTGGQVWAVPLAAGGKSEALFFTRGRSGDLAWSPDGNSLAFVSNRTGYGLLGLYTAKGAPIRWLAPTTDRVGTPVWSPDGSRIAYLSQPGQGGAPQTLLERHPRPWSIRVAEVSTGKATTAWASSNTLLGSMPRTQGGVNLAWGAGDRLVFLANLDNWPHLYSVPASGSADPLLLTPGNFMVEFVSLSPDRRFVVYNANTGSDPADDDRRHLFRVPVDAAKPVALTRGTDLEWSAVVTGDGATVAFLTSGPTRPPLPAVLPAEGGTPKLLGADRIPADFPASALVVPEKVVIPSLDATPIHLQLFRRPDGLAKRPALIYVHGGPPRQMLLGFHYWHYYASDYALNQYLANQGFVVASVNYRLGIGYGDRFMNPDNAGGSGASEYQDVVAAARYLASRPDVDPSRIGIWGGSYGGFLTALGLARNSDLFAAGVDIHGVHDRTAGIADRFSDMKTRPEKAADLDRAIEVMWTSSPVADMATWRSPVLLIHGDDDRNVPITQTVDLVQRLRAQGVRFEEMLIPDEIHDFLRYDSWLKVSRAASDFLIRELKR